MYVKGRRWGLDTRLSYMTNSETQKEHVNNTTLSQGVFFVLQKGSTSVYMCTDSIYMHNMIISASCVGQTQCNTT